ncbi:MAG: hypothetical protein AAGG48_22925 [Planctomycetota bacterium]
MESNPYQPPIEQSSLCDSREATIRRIRGPSTGIILLLIIQIVGYCIAGLILSIELLTRNMSPASPLEIVLAVGHVAITAFMLRAMVSIRRLRHLRSGRVAAGLACIPMVSPLFWVGIPFGIWLSVVLASSETASEFANPIDLEHDRMDDRV